MNDSIPVSSALDEETARAEVYGLLAALFYAPPSPDLLAQLRVAVTEAPAAGGFLEEPWRQFVGTVRELNDAALALGNGQPVPLPRTRLVEADAVAQAIQQAALILDQAWHQAQHDPLTGLCNRVLFNELLDRL